jgi:hypothetical protein
MRMRIMRPALAILLSLLWFAAAPAADAQNPSLAVVIARVQAPDPVANQGLTEWSQALERHIQTVGYEEMRTAYPGRSILVLPLTRRNVPSVTELSGLWRGQEAIYVIGATAVISGKTTRIDSLVYMGDFKGYLASELFPLRQLVQQNDYDASQRELEAVTLYGLGNQALAQRRRPVACSMYRRAATALGDPNLPAARMADLRAALGKSRAEQKC